MTGTVRGEDGITARMIHNTTRTYVAYVVYAWLLDAGQMTSLLYASYGVCENMNMVFYASEYYRDSVSRVGDTSHEIHSPDSVCQCVYVVVIVQVNVAHSRRGEADNSDACLVGADLESADDIDDELLDGVPVTCLKAAGGVEYEDNVRGTVAGRCG